LIGIYDLSDKEFIADGNDFCFQEYLPQEKSIEERYEQKNLHCNVCIDA
jgi:hypothetical protein